MAAWFRAAAENDDGARAHLGVGLTADQCSEVARIIESGVSLFSCGRRPPGRERIYGWFSKAAMAAGLGAKYRTADGRTVVIHALSKSETESGSCLDDIRLVGEVTEVVR